MKWRVRHSIGVAVGVTLIELLATAAVETRVAVDRPFVAVRDSAGWMFGSVHRLDAGQYRWRVEVARAPRSASVSSSLPLSDIKRPLVEMGMLDVDRNEFGGARRYLWASDVARMPVRQFDFPMKIRSSNQRRLAWWDAEGPSGIAPRALTLTRETPLYAAFGSAASERTDAPGALLRLLGWLITLLAAAFAGGWLRFRLSRRDRSDVADSSRLGRVLRGGGWVMAFLAAGCALAFGPSSGTGAAAAIRVMPFPGLLAPWAHLPYLAAVTGLLSAGIFGALVARHPNRVYLLPTAAIGLAYAATQLGTGSDFQIYLLAGRSLWAGANPYPLKTVMNPPPFLLFTMPLALLPVQLAAFLWFGIKAATIPLSLQLAAFAVSGAYGCSGGRRWARPEWIALLATGRLLGTDLIYGNTNLLVLVTLLMTAASWRARRPGLAGGSVVTGVAIKATPGMFAVAAALAGRWRWALATLLAAGAVTVISALAIEAHAPGAGMGFLRDVVPRSGDLSLGRVDNQSLRGWLTRVVGGVMVSSGNARNLPTLAWGAKSALQVEYAFVALVGLALAVVGRRARRAQPEEWDARWADVWAVATLAMLLVSPGSWTVHFALLYLPVAVLAARASRGDRLAGAVVLLLGLIATLPAFSHFLADWISATSALTIGSLIALATLLARPATPASDLE